MRTGVWYHDRPVTIRFPESWNVEVYWPDTPPPLTSDEIEERFASPVGQPPLRQLARGKKAPVLVVDDLSRPTPIFKILPFVQKDLKEAGISLSDTRILVATGTHGPQDAGALRNKLGRDATATCRVIVHDDCKGNRLVGKTSFGTPVYVNAEIVSSDCVIGIGGVYPQHTTAFGGGSKLALGVLGRTSIRHLHFRHQGVDGNYNIDNDFRRDVTEIARLIQLKTMHTVHIDANLDVVGLLCGDHFAYYPQAAHFSKTRYDAPPPSDADVVIANAYPFDISYNFMRKANKPIRCASTAATKIMIGSLHEGIGRHGLFPQGRSPRLDAYRTLYHRISVMTGKEIGSKVLSKLFHTGDTRPGAGKDRRSSSVHQENIWVYRPHGASTRMPPIPGITLSSDWEEILKVIERRHGKQSDIKIRIYPCAPLQCIDADGTNLSAAGE